MRTVEQQFLDATAVINLPAWSKLFHPGIAKFAVCTENYEYQVIRGLLQTISRARPTILMETGSPDSLAAGELLLQQGYEIWVSDGPQSLYQWKNGLKEANARFKDILFRGTGTTALTPPGGGAR